LMATTSLRALPVVLPALPGGRKPLQSMD
jgi:hypothetical protein